MKLRTKLHFKNMYKLINTFFIGILSICLTTKALAQNKPLACQDDASAGLAWEKGRWVTTSFTLTRFILVQDRNTLTVDSVGKAFGVGAASISCRNVDPEIHCSNSNGRNLFFSPQALKGSISAQFGSISNKDNRDTVHVQVFSCTPF